MEGGHAYADILFGDVNPSAKLPMTFPARLEDSPAHALDDYNPDAITFKEGVFIGYRWYEDQNIKPLFPFGHGLSYTDFEYSNLQISAPTMGANETLNVSYTVTNSGDRSGKEVTQLYIQDVESSVERPGKELKGFAKVALKPGESKVVHHSIDQRALSFWNTASNDWKAEAGDFNIIIGPSSNQVALQQTFKYQD
jgi:beta-glucosidase